MYEQVRITISFLIALLLFWSGITLYAVYYIIKLIDYIKEREWLWRINMKVG